MYFFQKHYENLLSKNYIKVFGGYEKNTSAALCLFRRLKLAEGQNKTALDLGAGAGFYSIPLSKVGYDVTAIDLDKKLVNEIEVRSNGKVKTLVDDILNFDSRDLGKFDLILCMTDVISHLNSYDEVDKLFSMSCENLIINGKFLISYRDQTVELTDCQRFFPFYSDESLIHTTFLEYYPEYLKVTDIFYERIESKWILNTSSFKKLRLFKAKINQMLTNNGFVIEFEECVNGMTYVLCKKK